jgi:hypothetical protein
VFLSGREGGSSHGLCEIATSGGTSSPIGIDAISAAQYVLANMWLKKEAIDNQDQDTRSAAKCREAYDPRGCLCKALLIN